MPEAAERLFEGHDVLFHRFGGDQRRSARGGGRSDGGPHADAHAGEQRGAAAVIDTVQAHAPSAMASRLGIAAS
ncbi:MAG: hypothetical protein ACR2KP_01930 [Egibacteraceae bacterium]